MTANDTTPTTGEKASNTAFRTHRVRADPDGTDLETAHTCAVVDDADETTAGFSTANVELHADTGEGALLTVNQEGPANLSSSSGVVLDEQARHDLATALLQSLDDTNGAADS